MGRYINQNSNGARLPNCGKADYIILDGGVEISEPKEWCENLVCVVENGPFDAALYCVDKGEYRAATNPNDHRPKRWIIYPKASELAD